MAGEDDSAHLRGAGNGAWRAGSFLRLGFDKSLMPLPRAGPGASAEPGGARMAPVAVSKRKADEDLPDEDTPSAKRVGTDFADAVATDPPGDDDCPGAGADDAPPAPAPAEGEAAQQAQEPPPAAPAHDPAYAAAACPDPPPEAHLQAAAAAATGAVGYHMPPFTGDSNVYSFLIDPVLVGRIIGKGGDTIKQLQFTSGAHIDIDQNYPEGHPRKVLLTGPAACIAACRSLLDDLLRTPAGPAPGVVAVPPGCTERVVLCPKSMVGRVIGRQGDVIKGLQAITGARIQIDQAIDPCRVSIAGSDEAVETAAAAVIDISQGGSCAPWGYAAYAARTAAGAGAGYGGQWPAADAYAQQAAYYGAYAYPQMAYGYHPGYAYPTGADYAAYAQQMQQQQPAAAGGAGASPAAGGGASPAGAAAGATGGGQLGWAAVDDGQGHLYYFNSATGESTWEKPEALK